MICPISWLLCHSEADEVVNLGCDSSLLTDYITLSSLSFTPDSNFQPVLSKYHWRLAPSADSDGKVGKLKVHGSNNVRSSEQRLRGFITSGSGDVRNKTLRVEVESLFPRWRWLVSCYSVTHSVLLLLYHRCSPTVTSFLTMNKLVPAVAYFIAAVNIFPTADSLFILLRKSPLSWRCRKRLLPHGI